MDSLVREDPASGGPMFSGGEEDKQADMDGLVREDPGSSAGPMFSGLGSGFASAPHRRKRHSDSPPKVACI